MPLLPLQPKPQSHLAASTNSGFTKYPSHFIDQKTTDPATTGPTLVYKMSDGDPITGTFLGPIQIRKFIHSDQGPQTAVMESTGLPLNAIARILLPFILLLAFLANIFILRTTYRLSLHRLPIAIYLVYLAIFDQIHLCTHGIDFMVEAFNGIRLFTAIQFLGRSACQLLPMAHSALRHIHASLLIGLAIDTCRLTRYPLWFSRNFQREWTLNVLLLSSVIAITLDCQFLWTFDLSQFESKLLHERVVHNAYECGFSQTSTLSPMFLYYIWPMIDHIWGELLPCIVLTVSGFASLLMRRMQARRERQNTTAKSITDHLRKRVAERTNSTIFNVGQTKSSPIPSDWLEKELVYQAIHTLALLALCNGLFILPRLTYYLTKYALFSNNHTARSGIVWLNYDLTIQHPTLQAMADTIQRVARLRRFEAPLEAFESLLRYLVPINIITNAAILTYGMTDVRQQGIIYWRWLVRFREHGKRIVYKRNQKPAPVENRWRAIMASEKPSQQSHQSEDVPKVAKVEKRVDGGRDSRRNNNVVIHEKERWITGAHGSLLNRERISNLKDNSGQDASRNPNQIKMVHMVC